MLARIWRGRTPKSKSAEYLEYVKQTGVKEYRETPGNRAVMILTRDQSDQTEFLVFTLWDSLDSIRAFAGEDVEAAKYYPEDAEFLLHFEPKVEHYHVPTAVLDEAAAQLIRGK